MTGAQAPEDWPLPVKIETGKNHSAHNVRPDAISRTENQLESFL